MVQNLKPLAGENVETVGSLGRLLIFFALLAGLGLTIYAESLQELFSYVLRRRESSHGIFVPFISAYLIWLRIDKLKRIRVQAALLPGCALMSAGFLLFYVGHGRAGFSLPALSFLLVAGGAVLALFGGDIFKEAAFPVFFLAAMIPLPENVYIQIADFMRRVNTWGAVALIKTTGAAFYREGYDIHLPGNRLIIDHDCSGIRYLLSYVAFSVPYAFRFKQKTKNRLLVMAVAAMLAFAGAVLRIGFSILDAYYFDGVTLIQPYHMLLSWSVFATLLVAAIAADRLLSKKG